MPESSVNAKEVISTKATEEAGEDEEHHQCIISDLYTYYELIMLKRRLEREALTAEPDTLVTRYGRYGACHHQQNQQVNNLRLKNMISCPCHASVRH